MSWDSSVPLELAQRWLHWLASLGNITDLKFPRCVIPEDIVEGVAELHLFCDASEAGYGACCYIRVINQWGRVHVALLASKARVAPVKYMTIPRLELSAAVLAVKLEQVVRRELNVSLLKKIFWSDSEIIIAYIRNDSRRFKVFVANRVSIIRDHSTPGQWHHVNSCDNPADVLSRGCKVMDLTPAWASGPQFLSTYKSSWPISPCAQPLLSDGDPEVRQREILQGHTIINDTLIHPMDYQGHASPYWQ